MDWRWLGDGKFDSYGYLSGQAYLKGAFADNSDPKTCYFIQDAGSANSADQFAIVPVDENGEPYGPPLYRTAGQVLYSTWEQGSRSADFDISNKYIK